MGNLGCGCNCDHNGRQEGITLFQQGDTFGLVMQYKEDNVAMPLPQGYDLIVGVFDASRNVIKKGSVFEGSIITNPNDTYTLPITHEESVKMIGEVVFEFTIADEQRNVVDHAESVVKFDFEPRKNNSLL